MERIYLNRVTVVVFLCIALFLSSCGERQTTPGNANAASETVEPTNTPTMTATATVAVSVRVPPTSTATSDLNGELVPTPAFDAADVESNVPVADGQPVDVEATATATPTPEPTLTPIPEATATATGTSEPTLVPTLLPTLSPYEPFDTYTRMFNDVNVNRLLMKAQVESTRDEIRNLAFTMNSAEISGFLDCHQVSRGFERSYQNSPTYQVPEDLSTVYYFYNLSILNVQQGMSLLYETCNALIDDDDPTTNAAQVAIESLKPLGLFEYALEFTRIANTRINDAVLWVLADEARTHELYRSVTQNISDFRHSLDGATLADCPELMQKWELVNVSAISYAPPGDYRLVAWSFYNSAVNAFRSGTDALVALCGDFLAGLNEGESAESYTSFIPQEMIDEAHRGSTIAINGIAEALAVEPGVTPTPTPFPIRARVIRTQPSFREYLYEIVVEITIRPGTGTPPYTTQVGGFLADGTNTIVITHICNHDFVDNVILTDANGKTFISQKISAAKDVSCDQWESDPRNSNND